MLSYLNPLPHLSKYKGPHRVGSTEFEIPVSEIESSTAVPDPTITTVKFRIFYPTTSSASSKQSIPWLPAPQKVWNQAYAQFMGISEKRAGWLSSLPSLLNYATIPAVQNGPLLEKAGSKQYPVLVFSHGLGGNCNTYSSLLGSLASCGVICVAPEHRDGSAPTSLVKSSRDKVQTQVAYRKVSHSPTPDVLNARNAQLRVRLWELELLYSAINQLGRGKRFTNFADTVPEDDQVPSFQSRLDLGPGRITWAGHSFGSATTVQFVKSIYYHNQAPFLTSTTKGEWNTTPLYTPAPSSDLIKQILPSSPVALLDLWTMPLRGEPSRWLWEKPLPCYERHLQPTDTPNVISIMSTEFYKWSELRSRTCAVLSSNADDLLARLQPDKQEPRNQTPLSPSQKAPAEKDLDEPAEPELMPIPSRESQRSTPVPSPPASASPSPSPSPITPPSSLSTTSATTTPAPAHLYLVKDSAHLSQSDFGPLFPNLTRYFMKALDPDQTIELNVQAILATMRACGLEVSKLEIGKGEKDVGRILEEEGVVERFERVRW